MKRLKINEKTKNLHVEKMHALTCNQITFTSYKHFVI